MHSRITEGERNMIAAKLKDAADYRGIHLVAFPADAHRVKGQVSSPSEVRKVVFKVKL